MVKKSFDELNGSSVEEWCVKYIDNGVHEPLTDKRMKTVTAISVYHESVDDDVKVDEMIKNDLSMSIFMKRVDVFFDYTVSRSSLIFISMIVNSPAKAVMMAAYLQYKSKKLCISHFGIQDICYSVFPLGLPSEDSLHNAWNNQKVAPSDAGKSDNMLDYECFYESIKKSESDGANNKE